MEKKRNKSTSSEFSQASETSDDNLEQSYISKHENDMTQLQEDIIYSIESVNCSFFIDLGGCSSIDLDFEVNKNGDFPLGLACAKSTLEIAKLILDSPTVNRHRVDNKGANCFWLACEGGKSAILPVLVEKNINYLIVASDGRNGLHAAVQNNHKNVVEYLIQMKYPLNIRIKDSVTALSLASQLGHIEIVKLLIEAGANPNKLSNKGMGALYLAIENENTKIAKYLLKNKSKMVLSSKYRDMSPLFLVIQTQNVEMLQKFKKHNVDLSAKNSQGQNPLQYAAVKEHTLIMNYLIKRMPNLDQEDDQGFTIFSRYILMENMEICENLLNSG